MKKQKKKPTENFIKSVIDDLKEVTLEPSITHEKKSKKPESAVGKLLFGSDDETNSSVNEKTTLLSDQSSEEKTNLFLGNDESSQISDKTLVASRAGGQPQAPAKPLEPEEVKVSFGAAKPNLKSSSYEAQFAQAENLKYAQSRIIELEKQVERLRKENEMLSSANEIAKQKIDDFILKIQSLDKTKSELKDQSESELRIFKDGLLSKDSEIIRLRNKVEELESRLSSDLKKIRVRERELENRLELSKLEKVALTRSKDDNILELKRKIEFLTSEVESYQHKVVDLNQRIEANNEQFGRTVRALRLALTNLEVNENTGSITIAPLKKAE